MDIRKIKKLIKLIEESDISKLEITEGKKTIQIVRFLSKESSDLSHPSLIKKDIKKISQCKSDEYQNTTNLDKRKTLEEYIVRSPIVGIFYRSSSPKENPFVTIGQSINAGDTLCIIEAMKVMNHIQADKSGIIQSILVNDGQPVEFNEPLLIIKLKKEENVK